MQTNLIGKRLKQVRLEVFKLSQFDFSDLLAMTQANLSMLENEKISPSCFLLQKLVTLHKVNINWLLTGEGNILVTTEQMPTEVKS